MRVVNGNFPGRRRRVRRHDGVTFNRHRQHEAVVVIRVFADDIDAAGSGHNPARFAAVMLFKFGGDVRGEFVAVHIK